MTDIIDRLRHPTIEGMGDGIDVERTEAADEIEKLRETRAELLAACQLSLRNAESIIYQQPAKIEDSVELKSLRTWRDTLRAAIAKAETLTPNAD